MELLLRAIFFDSTQQYIGTAKYQLQVLWQGNGEASEGWCTISCILILHLKEIQHGIEVQMKIVRATFEYSEMMLIENGYLPNLGNSIESQWK